MPWPSYGDAYAGTAGPPPGVALETYWHDGTDWVLSPYYAHRDGAWRLVDMYRLPANLDPEEPPDPTTTVFTPEDLLGVGQVLGTINDTAVMNAVLKKAAGRTSQAAGVTTEYLTLDLHGVEYLCEEEMLCKSFNSHLKKIIIDGNVEDPDNPGGFVQVTKDGYDGGQLYEVANPATVTTIAAASNGTPADSATITVASTAGFAATSVTRPASFRLGNTNVVYDDRDTGTRVEYTGKTSTTFTGCNVVSGTNITLTTGLKVISLPYPKQRNRYMLSLPNCRYWTFNNVVMRGPNSTGPALTNFSYDVEREAQHAFWLGGCRNMRFIDTKISQLYGDCFFTQTWRPEFAGASRDDDIYPGNIEILGGTWSKIGRIYVTMNQVRPADAYVPYPGFWKNPGDGTGAFEGGVNMLPAANDAPSLYGGGFGIWWHGNAAHPFLAQGCKRSMVDIENMNSYAHCIDVTMGADVTSFFPQQDRQHFHFTGPGLNLISAVNGWGLIRRLRIERVWHSGASGMSIRMYGSKTTGPAIGAQPATTIAAGSNGFVVPASGSFTINVTSTTVPTAPDIWSNPDTFATTGYLLVQNRTIKYTGKTTTTFTGCTLHAGTSFTLATGQAIRQRFYAPERPEYTVGDCVIVDNLFDGVNTMLLQLADAERMTVRRNRANYRLSNAVNEIQLNSSFDLPGLDVGVGHPEWGDNDFRGV